MTIFELTHSTCLITTKCNKIMNIQFKKAVTTFIFITDIFILFSGVVKMSFDKKIVFQFSYK